MNPLQKVEKKQTKENSVEELLYRGVVEIIDRNHLERRLLAGEKLRVKFGIDPTNTDLHIGHAVTIRKLEQFQSLGHQVVLIIGDFTAQIGDTSDQMEGRRMLSEPEVKSNEREYLNQIGKIIDLKKTEIHHNSEWLDKLTPAEWVKLASHFTIQQIIARENFAERIKQSKPVGLHETLYPLAQGYDSVVTRADVEIGGTDQLFNLMAGRKLQEAYGQKPQDIITMQLLVGIDGRKMSKSLGNTINIFDTPEDKYGKIMSITDQLIPIYLEMVTDVPTERLREVEMLIEEGEVNPMDLKKELAFSVVQLFDSKEAAVKAQKYFEDIIQRKETPVENIPTTIIERNILTVSELIKLLKLHNLVRSKSEGKRLLDQKGISINNETLAADLAQEIKLPKEGLMIKVGKRKFLRVIPKFS